MCILFISRNSSHAKYYRKLVKKMHIDAKLHVTGLPRLKSLFQISKIRLFDSTELLQNQILRKRARHPKLFANPLIVSVYKHCMKLYEGLRFLKFIDLLQDENPTKVVVWNGKKLPNQTVVCAAEALSISVMYFENGLVPNTTCLDPNGVNFTSSLPKQAEFYLKHQPSGQALNQIEPVKPHKNLRQSDTATQLPQRYIFVPFQVPNDTQVVVHSPWIKSMEQLFNEVMTAVSHIDNQDIKVVFKEHPNWPHKFEHLYQAHPKAIFANSLKTADLIKHADATITINSTVGMEALQLGGKVITLGDACYDITDMVLPARNSAQLIAQLNLLPHWQPNAQLIAHFLDFVNGVYAIPQAWRRANKQHILAIESRLLEKDRFSQHILS